MTPWIGFFSNPQALSMYDEPPSLGDVELLDCKYKQGLTTLELNLSLSDLPTNRSHRWPAEVNRIALTLQFDVVSSTISQSHSGGEVLKVHCSFRPNEPGFHFECVGARFNLAAECNYAWIKHLSGYIRAPFGQEQEYA